MHVHILKNMYPTHNVYKSTKTLKTNKNYMKYHLFLKILQKKV